MRTPLFIIFSTLSVLCHADTDALNEVMQNAHEAGRCALLSEMAEFQRAQNIEGGDVFVIEFVKLKAREQNMSFEAILEQCQQETGKYAALSQAANESNTE